MSIKIEDSPAPPELHPPSEENVLFALDAFSDSDAEALYPPIFQFHRILPASDDCYEPGMTTTAGMFEKFLAWLVKNYEVLPLDELLRDTSASTSVRSRRCALTFDDGWRDNYLQAFPLLLKYEVPATIFLATGFIGTGKRLWSDRLWSILSGRRLDFDSAHVADRVWRPFPWCPQLLPGDLTFSALRERLFRCRTCDAEEFVSYLGELVGDTAKQPEASFLAWSEVREMHASGISFGSHTRNHVLLTSAAPAESAEEIACSKRDLEAQTGQPVSCFAYPSGSTMNHVTQQVRRAGYEFAVTLRTAPIHRELAPFLVPRTALNESVLMSSAARWNSNAATRMLSRPAVKRGLPRSSKARHADGTEKIRIAFIIDIVDSWNGGGTEGQLHRIITSLDPQYFESSLFILENSPVLDGKMPCPVHLVPPFRWMKHMRACLDLYSTLVKFRPHIVQTFFPDATLLGSVVARVASVPMLIQSDRNMGDSGSFYNRRLLPWLRKLADGSQCNSRSIASVLRQSWPKGRVDILHNCMDGEQFHPPTAEERAEARRRLGLSEARPLFLLVSHLRPVKDLATCIRAAARVRQVLSGPRFVIIGEGPSRKELTDLIASLGLEDTVQLVGLQQDIRTWLAAADVGLLTSLSEGSSNAVMEYMASALPAVVSDIPANRELVDGVFFDPGDALQLAERILELWGDSLLRKRLGNEYRTRVLQYNGAAFAGRAQAYYVRLMSEIRQKGQ